MSISTSVGKPEYEAIPGLNVTYSLHSLEASHADAAAMALARAFMDDPLFEFIAPDADQRRRWLPVVMREAIRTAGTQSRSRVVLSESGRVVAAVVAGAYPPSLLSQLRQQALSLLFPVPWVPRLLPLLRVFKYMDDWEQRHYQPPHRYVYFIGVAPEHQHRGLGRKMMNALLAEGDAEGLPVYLETVKESNVRFYQALGFRIMDACRSHPEGPEAWMMLREVNHDPDKT
jgi:ribosomal protein S18 acetylase RimI-like enzyme